MRNMITYAEETLACFDRLPFNRVDSLILSWAAYLRLPEEHLEAHDWRGVRLGELLRAEDFGCLFQRHWDVGSSRRLFTALAASPRFRDIRVMGYTQQTDPEQEKQFYRLWTRKEAYGKLTGKGIGAALGVDLLPEVSPAVEAVAEMSFLPEGRCLVWEEYGVSEDYSIAFCQYTAPISHNQPGTGHQYPAGQAAWER